MYSTTPGAGAGAGVGEDDGVWADVGGDWEEDTGSGAGAGGRAWRGCDAG